MKTLFLTLLLVVCGWQTAGARDFTDAEKGALEEQIELFDAALTGRDFGSVGETVPPRVLEAIAARAGISMDRLRAALKAQMQIALASVKLVEFDMDFDKAQYRQTGDGTPYVLVPTRTLIETEGQKVEALSHTLALMDDGQWYLLRVSDAQQVNILRDVYPSFAKEEFPTGSTLPVR